MQARGEYACARVRAALSVAFGPDGPGILVVGGLPDWYPVARAALLESARSFAALPPDLRAVYECADVDYAVGWSCGREQFRGKVDTMKGSFYGNPCFDDPSNGDSSRAQYKHLLSPNIWPCGEDEARVGMEAPFKKVGQYIDLVGKDLAWHCDRYIESATGCTGFTKLHDALEASRAQKGRLLHYFPVPASQKPPAADNSTPSAAAASTNDMWCGFHNDHGALTGLVAGEFYDTRLSKVLTAAPGPTAGLYVAPRSAKAPLRVSFPADCIAFQTGEVAQLLSGGVLCATAHAVRAADRPGVARSTLALFLQPNPDYALELPPWDADGRAALVSGPRVPPLRERFAAGDTFAAFGAKSIQAYVVADD